MSEVPKFKGTELEHKAATFLKAQLKGFIQRDLFRFKERRQLEGLKNMKKNFSKTRGKLSRMMLNEYFALKEMKDRKDRKDSVSSSLPNSARRTAKPGAKSGFAPSLLQTSLQDLGMVKSFRKPVKNPSVYDQVDDEEPQQPIEFHPKMAIVSALKAVAKSIIEVPETREPSEGGTMMKEKEDSRRGTINNLKDVRTTSLLSLDEQ